VTTLEHPELVKLLQTAYSAERAAAFAYIGHARSVKDPAEREAIAQIEADEWKHRADVLAIMEQYNIPVSRFQEVRFYIVGRLIWTSCYLAGWFMPYYFAGRLESGNVCEYFRMMHFFEEVNITEHHEVLYEMGLKEREHEGFFLDGITNHKMLSRFEKLFAWGRGHSYNDVELSVARRHSRHAIESGDVADPEMQAEALSSDYCIGTKLSRVRLLDRPT
jgi:hypothetical protein